MILANMNIDIEQKANAFTRRGNGANSSGNQNGATSKTTMSSMSALNFGTYCDAVKNVW